MSSSICLCICLSVSVSVCSELVGQSEASRRGLACYIAAELVSVGSAGEGEEADQGPFIVGDGKVYGGFYNAPLEPHHAYRVWLGFIVTVDGVCYVCLSVSLPLCVSLYIFPSVSQSLYLTLPASSYPALRPYQLGPMCIPECNHSVTGSGYEAVNRPL